MCAAAGIQMVLGMHDQVAMTKGVQARIDSRLEEWETRQDAKAGGWGPSSMAEALAAYGVAGYEVRAYENRNQSLREAAAAMVRTGAPVDPHRMARCAHLGHDRLPRGRRPDRVPRRAHHGHQRVRPVVPDRVHDLGPVRSRGHAPGPRRDQAQLPPVGATRGRLPERDGKYLVVVPTIPLADQMGDAR